MIMLYSNIFTYIFWRAAKSLDSNFRNLILSQSILRHQNTSSQGNTFDLIGMEDNKLQPFEINEPYEATFSHIE